MEFVTWVQAHWDDILKAYLALIGLASVVVKLTPGIKDDAVLLKIIKFVGKYIALNVSRSDKISS